MHIDDYNLQRYLLMIIIIFSALESSMIMINNYFLIIKVCQSAAL